MAGARMVCRRTVAGTGAQHQHGAAVSSMDWLYLVGLLAGLTVIVYVVAMLLSCRR